MDPVTIAAAGVSDFDEPHRVPLAAPAPPAPAVLPVVGIDDAASLTEVGRLVVEIRLLQRVVDAAAVESRKANPATWRESVDRRERLAATLTSRRALLADLVTTIADRITTRDAARAATRPALIPAGGG